MLEYSQFILLGQSNSNSGGISMIVVDYTIIKARSLNELEEAVRTKINESVQKEKLLLNKGYDPPIGTWEPIGGPFFNHETAGWAQAIIFKK